MFRDNGGFDIVIGNPPYVRERDNKLVFEPVNNTKFGKMYHQGKMDYWYYFLHRAIEYTNEFGTISFITPRYWLNGAGASNLIKRIKNELNFTLIVDIGKLKVFDNVVGYHMIAQYSKSKNDLFRYKKLENVLYDIAKESDTNNVNIRLLKNSEIITENNEIMLEEQRKYKNCILLGEIADVSQGVVEASDKVSKRLYAKYPRSDVFIGKGIFVLTSDEVQQLELSEDEKKLLVPYVDGNNISRYNITENDNFLIYSDQVARQKIASDNAYTRIKAHLDNMKEYITSSNAPYGIHRPRKRYYFDNPKIIMPSMFVENNFTIDYEKQYYVGMSFSCIVVKESTYLLEYILATLNSTIAKEWFYAFGKKRGAGVDIGVDKVRTFPIKYCDISVQNEIAKKVKLLISDYASNIKLDSEVDEMIKKIYEENN